MRILLLITFGAAMSLTLTDAQSPSYPLELMQELTVVFIRYTPGEQPLRIQDGFAALSPDDTTLLSKYLPDGTAEIYSKSIHEDGPKAKAIIVLMGPFQHKVAVNQPWRNTVFYLQDGQTFKILPTGAALLDRRIYLEQQADAPRYTNYMVDLLSGGRQGGGACNGNGKP